MESLRKNPSDLVVIGVDVTEGPTLDLIDERVTEDLDNNLCADINQRGVFSPVVCRRTLNGLEVLDGRRRVLHAREVNRIRSKTGDSQLDVPVVIVEADDTAAQEYMLSANCNRLAENTMGLAHKVARLFMLLAAGDKLQEPAAYRRCAVAANVSEPTVRNYLTLVSLASEVQELVRTDAIGVAAAITLKGLNPSEQVAACKQLEEENKTHDASAARRIRDKVTTPAKPTAKVIKNMLFLAGLDAQDGILSADELPDYIVEVLKWFIGESDGASIPGLQGLQTRAMSREVQDSKKSIT